MATNDGLTAIHSMEGKLLARVPITPRDLQRIEDHGRIMVTFTIKSGDRMSHPALGDDGATIGTYDVFKLEDGRYATRCPGELDRYMAARARREANQAKAWG